MLKSFDDFLSTINDEDYNKMLEDAVNAVNSRKSTTTATNINDICLLQSISLLRKYHQWLSDQLT